MSIPNETPFNRADPDRPPCRNARMVDWLGGCKPLDLICGACGVIAVVSVVAHAAG